MPERLPDDYADDSLRLRVLPLRATPVGRPEAEEPESPDSELFLRRIMEQDPSRGCELLFRRYHKALCSHAVRFVYSREVAEDLVSEVFCRFWKTRAYATVTSSYRFYLFRSVRNEAYNHLRLEFQQLDDLDEARHTDGGIEQRPDQIMQYDEVLQQVEELVEQLPPQCRKVFLLNRFEGKRYQEVADELGISIKTVEVHIVKALALVRKGLKNHWLMLMLPAILARFFDQQ